MKFVEWQCGCIGITAGWRKGQYVHFVLKPHDRLPDSLEHLFFVKAPHVVDTPVREIHVTEENDLLDNIRQAFKNDLKYRLIKGALTD